MANQIQRRRGTAAENAAFVGVEGEVTYSTDEKRLITHDGSTVGGEKQAKKSEVDAKVAKAGDSMSGTLSISPAVDTNALAVTGYSLTGANAQSLFDLAGTWNTTGAPSAIKLNITNTASVGASLLDLQVGGNSLARIDASGFGFLSRHSADTIQPGLQLLKRGHTGDVTAAIGSGGGIGVFAFGGWDGTAYVAGASIRGFSTQAWTGSLRGSKFLFLACPSGSTAQSTLATLDATAFTLSNGPGVSVITPAVNTAIFATTGFSLTGSSAVSLFNLAGTWNTSGNPTALKLNVTNTASGATSLLLDLQASSVSKFNVSKAGNVTIVGSLTLPYRAIVGTDTFSATDHTIDATSGTFTVNLPTAVGIAGRVYVMKNSGAGVITVDGNGTETIDGALTDTVGTLVARTYQSNGTNWIIL